MDSKEERNTRKGEKTELRRNTLKREKPWRKGLLKAVKSPIHLRAWDVVEKKKTLIAGSDLNKSYHCLSQFDTLV